MALGLVPPLALAVGQICFQMILLDFLYLSALKLLLCLLPERHSYLPSLKYLGLGFGVGWLVS